MARKKTKKIRTYDIKDVWYVVLAVVALLFAIVVFKYFIFSPNKNAAPKTQAAQTKELIKFVDSAAKLVEEKGEEAFLDFKNDTWNLGEKYIFVYDINGNTKVLPPQPELEGVNRLDASDPNGVYFVKDMINQAYNKSSGWVNYMYTKPGATSLAEKLSYFKKVLAGGKYYIVGSGIYLD